MNTEKFNAEAYIKHRMGLPKDARIVTDWKSIPKLQSKFKNFGDFLAFIDLCEVGGVEYKGEKVSYDAFITRVLIEVE